MRLKVSERARADLLEIYLTSARTFGERQAETYYLGLMELFAHLTAFPLSSNVRSEYRGSIRVVRHQSHQIAYRVRRNEVLIVRVLHGARDLKRHL